jgi:hypothetical protein
MGKHPHTDLPYFTCIYAQFEALRRHFHEETDESQKHVSQDSWSPRRDLITGPPKYMKQKCYHSTMITGPTQSCSKHILHQMSNCDQHSRLRDAY